MPAATSSASGLAAGSLTGLASLALAFGLPLAAASSGLVLIVGAAQRRRSMVALAVLGADARQCGGFLWTEARTLTVAGVIGGLMTGALIAAELIKVLNGIFDPPPQRPAVPWTFICAMLLVVLAAAAIAPAGQPASTRPDCETCDTPLRAVRVRAVAVPVGRMG